MDVFFYDSLYGGDSAKGWKLSLGLSEGDFWCRQRRCQALYRDVEGEDIELELLAVHSALDVQFVVPEYVDHEPLESFTYLLRRVNRCGAEEKNLSAVVFVRFDAQGELVSDAPSGVLLLQGNVVASGTIRLRWFHYELRKPSTVQTFRVYSNGGSGDIQYSQPVAEVAFRGRRVYETDVSITQEGSFTFALRVMDSDGAEGPEVRVRVQVANAEVVPLDVFEMGAV